MKNSKKFLSVLCAVCVLLAMSISASAETLGAVTYTLDPDYQPERYVGQSAVGLRAMDTPHTGYMPYQNTAGTTGGTLFSFTTDSDQTEVKFNVIVDGYGVNDLYSFQLYRVNGAGIPDSKIGTQRQGSFNSNQNFDNLLGNTTYYIKVSSRNVDSNNGADCSYGYEVY